MSDWDEKVQRAAEALDMGAIEATEPGEVRLGFRKGARWQRKVLLSDEAVERAARNREVIAVGEDSGADPAWVVRTVIEAALTAALGEDENDE